MRQILEEFPEAPRLSSASENSKN